MTVKLSKELLETEYLVNKLNSYEIAVKYGCTATWINILRRRYKIKTLRPYERNLKQSLSRRQREYIYGSLLGDGSMGFGIAGSRRGNKNGFFRVAQTHKGYVELQSLIMQDFIKSSLLVHLDKRPNRRGMYYFYTISHPIFTNLYKEIYPKGVKTVSNDWLRHLTPHSLAIWYMDDGSIARSNYQTRISTESFSFQEHLLLQRYFKRRWDICVDIKSSSRKGKFLLSFRAKERNKFFLLIKPYIISEMEYKICCSERKWNRWTSFEKNYLRQNYFGRKTNWKMVLKALNHSKQAIMRKASDWGLTNKYLINEI